ncbi:MAG: hypothetical protein M0013_06680 [Actinomycetota bacterium]|jgi:hypothetical protein|nr:hypothetical protein [Actinomycetota bacterium]
MNNPGALGNGAHFPTGGTPAVRDITRSANGDRAAVCLVLPSPTELR